MNGTSSMKKRKPKNLLTSETLCAIIRQCTEGGVKRFDIQGVLSIEFYRGDELTGEEITPMIETSQRVDAKTVTEESQDQIEKSSEFLKEQELDNKDDEIHDMSVEDPEKFEELLTSGELAEEEGENAEDNITT